MIFSSDVDQVSQGFSTTYAALATDRTERFQTELIDGRATIISSTSCEVAVSPGVSGSEAPCQLYRQGGAASQPSDVEVALKRTKDTLQPALQNYTHALAAVTNAADRAAYDAAVGQLASALCGITKAAGPTGAAACQGVTAGVDIIGWLIGQRLDNQRFDSLKAAVNAVGSAPEGRDSAMKIITDALGKGLRDARDKRLSTLNEELGSEKTPLGPTLNDAAYRQRLAQAEALAANIEALRQADPVATANAINTAHNALVKAVNDPSRELPTLLTALQTFSGKAQALQTALSAGAAPHAVSPKPTAAAKLKNTSVSTPS